MCPLVWGVSIVRLHWEQNWLSTHMSLGVFSMVIVNHIFSLCRPSETKSQRHHILSRQLQVSAWWGTPRSKRDPTSGPGRASGSGSSTSPVGNALCAHGYWSERACVSAGFLGDLCTQAWVAPLLVVLGTAAGLCRRSLSSLLWNWVIPRHLRFLPNVPPISHSWLFFSTQHVNGFKSSQGQSLQKSHPQNEIPWTQPLLSALSYTGSLREETQTHRKSCVCFVYTFCLSLYGGSPTPPQKPHDTGLRSPPNYKFRGTF